MSSADDSDDGDVTADAHVAVVTQHDMRAGPPLAGSVVQ